MNVELNAHSGFFCYDDRILFISNVQQQASVQSSQRNRSTSSATKDNNSNTSTTTTTKSRGAFFTSSASLSEDSLLSEPTTNDLSNINHSLKLTHFFPLKSSDFSLTVLGQLQFELVFKQQNISLIMEAASIGTMWSAMSALTNAIKELNQLATSTVDGNSTDVDAHSWYQYYVNQCSSVTRSSSIGSTASSTNVDESNSLASSSSAVSSSLSSITDSLIERSSDYNLNSRDGMIVYVLCVICALLLSVCMTVCDSRISNFFIFNLQNQKRSL